MKLINPIVVVILLALIGFSVSAKDKPKPMANKQSKIKIAKDISKTSPMKLSIPNQIIEGVSSKLQMKIEKDFQERIVKQKQ